MNKIRLIVIFILFILLVTFISISNTEIKVEKTVVTKLSNKDQVDQLNNIISLEEDKKIKIATNLTPVYHWLRFIIGEDNYNIEPILMQTHNSNIHTYYPDTNDIVTLLEADIFIQRGYEYDDWSMLYKRTFEENNTKVINLVDLYKEYKNIDDDDIKLDGHFYLSLKNAKYFVHKMANEISRLDIQNAKSYNDNALIYINELSELDSIYEYSLSNSSYDTLVFADQFPFKYLFDDYNLNYVNIEKDCNEFFTTSDDELNFLASTINDKNLKAVFTITETSPNYAEKVVELTNRDDVFIYELNAIENTSNIYSNITETYMSTMRSNLEIILKAIN